MAFDGTACLVSIDLSIAVVLVRVIQSNVYRWSLVDVDAFVEQVSFRVALVFGTLTQHTFVKEWLYFFND